MTVFRWMMMASVTSLVMIASSMAQPPEREGERPPRRPNQEGPDRERPRDGEGRPRDGEGRPPQGPEGFRPPPPPLEVALDANRDGELSAEEIANAAAALKSLDKNGDGRLDREELRPPRPFPGEFGRPGDGRPGPGPDQRPNFDGNPEEMLARFMKQDANGDGKVTKDELPEARQRMLQFADRDQDGGISREEAREMLARFRQNGGPEGRPNAGRPDGDRPRGEGRGDRPPRENPEEGERDSKDRPDRPERD